MNRIATLLLLLTLISISSCSPSADSAQPAIEISELPTHEVRKIVESAIEQSRQTTIYDPSYQPIAYPNGDVPIERGVCADVIVRAFRNAGIDLQKEIHLDMNSFFGDYPNLWGAKAPDKNIDHRRVANLMKYFERQGSDFAITDKAEDYLPGDIVAWKLSNGRLHIGIVTNIRSDDERRFLMAHNLARGVQIEDRLFSWEVIGHYRPFE